MAAGQFSPLLDWNSSSELLLEKSQSPSFATALTRLQDLSCPDNTELIRQANKRGLEFSQKSANFPTVLDGLLKSEMQDSRFTCTRQDSIVYSQSALQTQWARWFPMHKQTPNGVGFPDTRSRDRKFTTSQWVCPRNWCSSRRPCTIVCARSRRTR